MEEIQSGGEQVEGATSLPLTGGDFSSVSPFLGYLKEERGVH
jgi:hypothetical protein